VFWNYSKRVFGDPYPPGDIIQRRCALKRCLPPFFGRPEEVLSKSKPQRGFANFLKMGPSSYIPRAFPKGLKVNIWDFANSPKIKPGKFQPPLPNI